LSALPKFLFTLELLIGFGWPFLQMLLGTLVLPVSFIISMVALGRGDGLQALSGWFMGFSLYMAGFVAFLGLYYAARAILDPNIPLERVSSFAVRIRWGLVSFAVMFVGLVALSLYERTSSPLWQFLPTFLVTLHIVYLLPAQLRARVFLQSS
jgi:hypothetical protein